MANKPRTFLQFGVPESDADLLYASGFPAPDPVLFITHRGKNILVVTDFECSRARSNSKADEAWGSFALASEEARRRRLAVPDLSPGGLALAALRRLETRAVEVPEGFPLGLGDRLREAGVRLVVRPGPAYPQRLSKGAREVRLITEVLRHCERALGAVASMLRNGRPHKDRVQLFGRPLLVEDLRRVINLTLMEADCVAAHTIVAPGDQAVDPHNEGSGPIHPGEPVVIDIFPRSNRTFYFADITRTMVCGHPAPVLVRQYQAVAKAQQRAIALIGAGVSVRRVHRAVQQTFEELGYRTGERDGHLEGFTHSTGHGVGLEIHEPPKIGQVDPSIRFRKGMVVTVEPGLYYLGPGGVRLEDMVVVTERGCRNLTRFPKRLQA